MPVVVIARVRVYIYPRLVCGACTRFFFFLLAIFLFRGEKGGRKTSIVMGDSKKNPGGEDFRDDTDLKEILARSFERAFSRMSTDADNEASGTSGSGTPHEPLSSPTSCGKMRYSLLTVKKDDDGRVVVTQTDPSVKSKETTKESTRKKTAKKSPASPSTKKKREKTLPPSPPPGKPKPRIYSDEDLWRQWHSVGECWKDVVFDSGSVLSVVPAGWMSVEEKVGGTNFLFSVFPIRASVE